MQRVPKPRVVARAETTSALVSWRPGGAPDVYFVVRYTRYGSSETISMLSVKESPARLTALAPATRYTAYVSAVMVTQRGQEGAAHFETSALQVMPSVGAGSALFPPGPPAAIGHACALRATSRGYVFDASSTDSTGAGARAVVVDGRAYQFATFRAGTATGREPHLDLRLVGAAGAWTRKVRSQTRFAADTIVQVKVDAAAAGAATPGTGWLDACSLRVAGIVDDADGGRVFDGFVGDDGCTFRVTLASEAREGDVFVRVGVADDGRSLGGVVLLPPPGGALDTDDDARSRTSSI